MDRLALYCKVLISVNVEEGSYNGHTFIVLGHVVCAVVQHELAWYSKLAMLYDVSL
jgi:hypothetical protein